jgi:hypothetical protein
LYDKVVYLGNKVVAGGADALGVFKKKFYVPFASSSMAQRRDPAGAVAALMKPSNTRVSREEKTRTLGYLAHNCVWRRDQAFARLCEIFTDDCEPLGMCPLKSTPTAEAPQALPTTPAATGSAADARYSSYYLDEAVSLLLPFKFALVFENAIAPGYVTEKIVNAFLAGAVPIYWGDHAVLEIFDRRAFVFVDAPEDGAWLNEVMALAEDEEKYEAMRSVIPVKNASVFSWLAEVGDHALGREIVDAVTFLAVEAKSESIEEKLKKASSIETFLATTEFPGGHVHGAAEKQL